MKETKITGKMPVLSRALCGVVLSSGISALLLTGCATTKSAAFDCKAGRFFVGRNGYRTGCRKI